MKTDNMKAMSLEELELVNGGKTNKGIDPTKMDPGIDGLINGKNYDLIAQLIADWLNGDTERTRNVGDRDIYDCVI